MGVAGPLAREVARAVVGVPVETLADPPDLVGAGRVRVPPDHGGVVTTREVDALPDTVLTPRQVQAGGRRGRRGGEPEQPGPERLGREVWPGEVHTGEEHERRLHEFAEGLRRGRVPGLPRDQVAELVHGVGGAGGQERHAERVSPLLLVVLTPEHRGVGEGVPEDDPLGEVLLRSRFLGKERREHRIASEDDARDACALELGDHVARILLGGREVERVRHRRCRLHVVRGQAAFEVRDAPGERARVVVVVHDAEHASLGSECFVARVRGPAARELLPDEGGPVLARLFRRRHGGPHVGRVAVEERLRLGDDAVAHAQHPACRELVGVRRGLPGSAERRERVHLGGDLDRVGFGGDVVVGRAARLDRHQLDLAAVELVVRGEVVDVLLGRLPFLGEALVAAGVLEERLLEEVGLCLVERDRDRVRGHPRGGRTAVVALHPWFDARGRIPARHREPTGRGVTPRPPVHLLALCLGLVERERRRPAARRRCAHDGRRRDQRASEDERDHDDGPAGCAHRRRSSRVGERRPGQGVSRPGRRARPRDAPARRAGAPRR